LRLQLTGGDDYLLLFTLPEHESVPQGCYPIGRISQEKDIRVSDLDGKPMSFSSMGYNHFKPD
jgi:thiamine-monophosphate kinase